MYAENKAIFNSLGEFLFLVVSQQTVSANIEQCIDCDILNVLMLAKELAFCSHKAVNFKAVEEFIALGSNF